MTSQSAATSSPNSAHCPVMVFGEALIDVLATGDTTFEGVPGGAPANVAGAASRLGMPVEFVGGLSTDRWGDQLAAHLTDAGVDVSRAPRIDRPTALAIVDVDDSGTASYRFLWDHTADRAVTADLLPDASTSTWLQVGSVAAAFEDSGAAVEEWVRTEHDQVLVSCDPNARPGVHGESMAVRGRLLGLADGADLVKTSDEDLTFLLPDLDIDEAMARWLRGHAKVVAITRGPHGALLGCGAGTVTIPPVEVTVADTVAAGDTFMAALLMGLADVGATTHDRLADLDLDTLQAVGMIAAQAASITVSRSGANPPTRSELDPALLQT